MSGMSSLNFNCVYVSLVDNLTWTEEAGGSNPPTQTYQCILPPRGMVWKQVKLAKIYKESVIKCKKGIKYVLSLLGYVYAMVNICL